MTTSSPNRSPRVSVIIPTRNRLASLRASLESVLSQTYTDFHVIIVDDGSTDGTAEWIASLNNPQIQCLTLEQSLGAGGARNQGLELARSEWIAFQDSDDTWHPEKLEKQMTLIDQASSEMGAVYCRCRRISEHKEYTFPPEHVEQPAGHIFETMLAGNLISTQTAVVHRDMFTNFGNFNEQLPPLEDWEFFLRISRHVRIGLVDEILVDAPFSEDSISHHHAKHMVAFLNILELYRDDFQERRHLLAKHLGTIADGCYRADMRGKGMALYFRAARINPSRWTHWAGFVLGMLGRRAYERCTARYTGRR